MKKNYKCPVLSIEKFMTDQIMDSNNYLNVLSQPTPYYESEGGMLDFGTGDANVLNSIDYTQFTN